MVNHIPCCTGVAGLKILTNFPYPHPTHETLQTSKIGYLPIIDASPTEYSTINAILQRSEKIAVELDLTYATLVFNEAVYAKIQHVRWKNEHFYKRFIVRLGEFHVIMSYVSAVSKLFEDGGLKVRKPTIKNAFDIFYYKI